MTFKNSLINRLCEIRRDPEAVGNVVVDGVLSEQEAPLPPHTLRRRQEPAPYQVVGVYIYIYIYTEREICIDRYM